MTAETEELMPRDYLTLFPDTNSLLHYPSVSNVDWQKACGAKEVRLVLCMQVIHELDDKKSDSRLSDRAHRVIKEIEEASPQSKSVREGVSLEVFGHELRREEFVDALSPDSKDDRIIHLVKKYTEKTSDTAVAVYSEDLGMALRCKAYSIELIKPNPSTRLLDPQTELGRKYKAVVIENEALKNRIPKLEVRVCIPGEKPGPPQPFKMELDWKYDKRDPDYAVWEERQRLQLRDPSRSSMGYLSFAALNPLVSLGMMTQEDNNRYNEELSDYLAKYQEWVENENLVAEAKARAVAFEVQISNMGNCPAEDVEVWIDFPSRFQALSWNDETVGQLPETRQRPIPPKPPRNPLFAMYELGRMQEPLSLLHNALPVYRPPFPPTRDWSVDLSGNESDGFHIRICIDKLNHFKQFSKGSFTAVFRSWEDAGSFQATGQVTAGNMPDKMDLKVPFVVSIKEQ